MLLYIVLLRGGETSGKVNKIIDHKKVKIYIKAQLLKSHTFTGFTLGAYAGDLTITIFFLFLFVTGEVLCLLFGVVGWCDVAG